MNTNKYLIPALLVTAVLFSACKKKEPDTSKYADICAKVVKCDAQFGALPDAQGNCQKFLGVLETKYPTKVSPIVDCLQKAKCEELSFTTCGSSQLQELQGGLAP